MNIASPEDLDLINQLIDKGLVEKSELIALLETQKQDFERQKQQLLGTLFLIDPAAQELRIIDQASDKVLQTRPLPQPSLRPGDWEKWGSHLALLQPGGSSLLAALDWELLAPYGLIISAEGSYLYEARGLKAEWLPQTSNRLCGGICRVSAEHGPYDLHAAPDGSLLALVDRGGGSIELIATKDLSSRLKVKLRPAGGSSALNLAFDLAHQRLLVTDQSSSQLLELDLRSGDLKQHKLGAGMLGNLVLAPDGEHVYVLTLKPGQELIHVRTSDWQVRKSLLLKGDLYRNQGNDPCDLLSLSPDGQHLVVMSYLHAPEPFTPLLSVIDTQQVKTIRRYSLKDGAKPCQLLFARSNPLRSWQHRDIRDIILSAGLVEAATLNQLLSPGNQSSPGQTPLPQAPDQSEPAAPRYNPAIPPEADSWMMAGQAAPAEAQAPGPVLSIEDFYQPVHHILPGQASPKAPAQAVAQPAAQPAAQAAQAEPEPEPEARPEPVLTQAPDVAPIELDDAAEASLLELLAEGFRQRSGVDALARPIVATRLKAEATRLRALLSRHELAEVELEKLADGQDLRMSLSRRELLLHREQRAWLEAHPDGIVPLDCPQCSQKLMGQWECQVCGFELENSLRRFKRLVASAEPAEGLAIGNFLLPDPEAPRLLELNARKELVWHLDADQLSCETPVDLIRMQHPQAGSVGGGHLLVADKARSQIYEIGRRGRIHWSFQTFASEQHRLKEPVRISWYRPEPEGPVHYLVVDQGRHRVLELDKEHAIHWQYGESDVAGSDEGQLNAPSDLQYTPERSFLICDAGNGRVIEIERSGRLVTSFDAGGYGLVRPVLARRIWTGETLIVDAGAFMILVIAPGGSVSDRISYYKPGMPDELRLVDPTGLIRLPNQDLVLYNGSRVLQLLPRQKKLLWTSKLQDIKATSPAGPPAPFQPPAPIAPPPVAEAPAQPATPELDKQGLKQSLSGKVAGERKAFRETLDKLKPRQVSPQDRVQALLNKRNTPSNQESFEHAVLFMRPGTELEALSLYLLDWRHNALLRVNRKGKLTWHYGFEMGQKLSKPNFVQDLGHSLLVCDSDQHRILEISRADKEVRQVLTGPPDSPLHNPRSALRLADGKVLIADQRNKRLVELDAQNRISWEFWHEMLLASPQYVEPLPDGDLLFTDSLLNRVTQIDREGRVRWYYGATLPARGHSASLFGPSYATRLPDGNTLIADTRNHRVLEVNPGGETVWEYVGHARNSRINPTFAKRLPNGHTLISYFNHSKIIELNPQNQCLWSYTIGKDVFLPPVEGDDDSLVRVEAEKPTPFYNAVEKRLLQTARQNGQEITELHIELMDNVQMKSVRAQVIMFEVEKHGMVFKSFPPPEDLLADRYGKFLIVTCTLESGTSPAVLGRRIANIAEVVRVEVREPKAGP